MKTYGQNNLLDIKEAYQQGPHSPDHEPTCSRESSTALGPVPGRGTSDDQGSSPGPDGQTDGSSTLPSSVALGRNSLGPPENQQSTMDSSTKQQDQALSELGPAPESLRSHPERDTLSPRESLVVHPATSAGPSGCRETISSQSEEGHVSLKGGSQTSGQRPRSPGPHTSAHSATAEGQQHDSIHEDDSPQYQQVSLGMGLSPPSPRQATRHGHFCDFAEDPGTPNLFSTAFSSSPSLPAERSRFPHASQGVPQTTGGFGQSPVLPSYPTIPADDLSDEQRGSERSPSGRPSQPDFNIHTPRDTTPRTSILEGSNRADNPFAPRQALARTPPSAHDGQGPERFRDSPPQTSHTQGGPAGGQGLRHGHSPYERGPKGPSSSSAEERQERQDLILPPTHEYNPGIDMHGQPECSQPPGQSQFIRSGHAGPVDPERRSSGTASSPGPVGGGRETGAATTPGDGRRKSSRRKLQSSVFDANHTLAHGGWVGPRSNLPSAPTAPTVRPGYPVAARPIASFATPQTCQIRIGSGSPRFDPFQVRARISRTPPSNLASGSRGRGYSSSPRGPHDSLALLRSSNSTNTSQLEPPAPGGWVPHMVPSEDALRNVPDLDCDWDFPLPYPASISAGTERKGVKTKSPGPPESDGEPHKRKCLPLAEEDMPLDEGLRALVRLLQEWEEPSSDKPNPSPQPTVVDKTEQPQSQPDIPVLSIPSPLSPPNTDLLTPRSAASAASPRPLNSPQYSKNLTAVSSQGTTSSYSASRWKSPVMDLSHTVTDHLPSKTHFEVVSEVSTQGDRQPPQVIARPPRPISRSRDVVNTVVSPAVGARHSAIPTGDPEVGARTAFVPPDLIHTGPPRRSASMPATATHSTEYYQQHPPPPHEQPAIPPASQCNIPSPNVRLNGTSAQAAYPQNGYITLGNSHVPLNA